MIPPKKWQRFFPVAAILPALFLLFFSACEVDHGLHPVPITGIGGTVTFVGDWPEDTEWVRIACFSEIPAPNNFLEFIAFLKGLSDPLPIGVKSYKYVMELDPGIYKWVVVVWKAREQALTDIRVLGTYQNPGNPAEPGRVVVKKNKLTAHINITADFSRLNIKEAILHIGKGSVPLANKY